MVRLMRWPLRGALAGALVAVLLTAGLAFTASPATAHTKLSPSGSCPGSELSPHRHATFSQGTVTVFISYSSASGGTNCAWAQKQFARGTPTSMDLHIARCDTGDSSRPCQTSAAGVDSDPGNWRYYAGPVTVTGTAGKCIIYNVRIGSVWSGWSQPIHCG